jgi:hypothetical protein
MSRPGPEAAHRLRIITREFGRQSAYFGEGCQQEGAMLRLADAQRRQTILMNCIVLDGSLPKPNCPAS